MIRRPSGPSRKAMKQRRFIRVRRVAGDGDAVADVLAAELGLDRGKALEVQLDLHPAVLGPGSLLRPG